MKKLHTFAITAMLFLLFISQSTAEVDTIKEMTVVVPAESIAKFIKPLIPYRVDFGKNYSGSFWIKSIKNIKIVKDRLSFSSHIYGKDIEYSAKIGSQRVNFVVGNVNLQNRWEVSLRYAKNTKKLYIKPQHQGTNNKNELNQGDNLLNTLLEALSDIEYPIELNNLKPIKTELYDSVVTIKMDISDIYVEKDKLFIEIIPTPRVESSSKP